METSTNNMHSNYQYNTKESVFWSLWIKLLEVPSIRTAKAPGNEVLEADKNFNIIKNNKTGLKVAEHHCDHTMWQNKL